MNRLQKIVFYAALAILTTYFLFRGLIEAKSFLAPFFTAIILSLLMLPLARKMEKKIKRPLASFFSSFLLFLVSLLFTGLVLLQIKQFASDWPQIKQKMQPKVEHLQDFAVAHTPVKKSQLTADKLMEKISGNTAEKSSTGKSSLLGIFSFLGNYLLAFIYVFFLLTYRRRLKIFILKLFPKKKNEKIKSVISKSVAVVPQYLIGKLILIGVLAVLYGIGLGLSGINNFILISILAALLSIIPYIGNIIGFLIAAALGFSATGDANVLIGIALTFAVAQFVESYVMEPYIVGDKVDVHPFIVILSVIIGNLIWGVIGMILAIPLVGILTVFIIHIKELQIVGEFLSRKKWNSVDS